MTGKQKMLCSTIIERKRVTFFSYVTRVKWAILKAPLGDRSMSTSLSAPYGQHEGPSQPRPSQPVPEDLMKECVECLEQGSCGSILQFMPFTMVSELVKLPVLAKPKVVLGITDLTLPLGRSVAAKASFAL
eukprot:XP_014014465.1 PREDICTED: mediator of RNA polymerase II transcription subunit 24-like [Salmo salar]